MMRSEKCCGCLPAYGVCRSDFIAQLNMFAKIYSLLLPKILLHLSCMLLMSPLLLCPSSSL